MSSLVKFTYFVSIVFFLATLFFTYYQFPDYVPIGFSENIQMKQLISKSTLFYAGASLFFIFNILLLIIKMGISKVPFKVIPFPSKDFWLQDIESKEALHLVVRTWFNSYGAAFNLFIGYILFALFLLNVVELNDFSFYVPAVYLGIISLSLWWIILVVRLKYKKLEM